MDEFCTSEQQKAASRLISLLKGYPRVLSDEEAARTIAIDPELEGLIWGRSRYAYEIAQAYRQCFLLGLKLELPLPDEIQEAGDRFAQRRGNDEKGDDGARPESRASRGSPPGVPGGESGGQSSGRASGD